VHARTAAGRACVAQTAGQGLRGTGSSEYSPQSPLFSSINPFFLLALTPKFLSFDPVSSAGAGSLRCEVACLGLGLGGVCRVLRVSFEPYPEPLFRTLPVAMNTSTPCATAALTAAALRSDTCTSIRIESQVNSRSSPADTNRAGVHFNASFLHAAVEERAVHVQAERADLALRPPRLRAAIHLSELDEQNTESVGVTAARTVHGGHSDHTAPAWCSCVRSRNQGTQGTQKFLHYEIHSPHDTGVGWLARGHCILRLGHSVPPQHARAVLWGRGAAWD
jgi:hypothetical protein